MPNGGTQVCLDLDSHQSFNLNMTQDKTPSLEGAYALETPEDNLRLYADWAETYDKDFSEAHSYISPQVVAEQYVSEGGGSNVLDVGAGTGLLGEELIRRGVTDVDATDISAEMLAVAKGKDVYRDLFVGDLTDRLAVADETYDGIVSSGTFTNGHVGPDAFDELLRITKAGGLFVLSINSQHFEAKGFATKFAALGEKITDLKLPEKRIYAEDAEGPHKDDTALFASFRKS